MQKNLLRHLASAVALVIATLLALGSKDSSDKKADSSRVSEEAETQSASPRSENYAIGEKVSAPPLEVMINSAQQKLRVGNDFFSSSPAEGAAYVAINWQYKNIGREPLSMWSKPDIKLRDAEGIEYSEDIGAGSSYATEADIDEKALSDLNPGITVKSAAVFEISKEAIQKPNWTIVIEGSDGEILFNLN